MTHEEACNLLVPNQHLAEARRAVATAKVEEFLFQCERMAYLVSTGEVDKSDAACCIHEIAEANGIYETFGTEDVVAAISDAFGGDGERMEGWGPDQSAWDNAVAKDGEKPSVEASKGAQRSTVDALMLSLRAGVGALSDNLTLRRLSILDIDQLADCCMKLQKLSTPWQKVDIDKILDAWGRGRA